MKKNIKISIALLGLCLTMQPACMPVHELISIGNPVGNSTGISPYNATQPTALDNSYTTLEDKINTLTVQVDRALLQGKNRYRDTGDTQAAKKALFKKLKPIFPEIEHNIDTRDENGYTPLLFVALGYDPNIPVSFNSMKDLEILRQLGADIKASTLYKQRTILHIAEFTGKYTITNWAIKHEADVNAQDQDGNTPLHLWAMYHGNQDKNELVNYINKNNVNIKNNKGNTPLHEAVSSNNFIGANVLLTKGANVHAKNKNGDTPLHCAIQHESETNVNRDVDPAILKLLLDAGADIQAKNNQNKTAVDLAHSPAIRQLLRDYKPTHLQGQTTVTPAQ